MFIRLTQVTGKDATAPVFVNLYQINAIMPTSAKEPSDAIPADQWATVDRAIIVFQGGWQITVAETYDAVCNLVDRGSQP